MKKLLALLAVVLAVVSCQKEINGLAVDSNNEAAVSLSVALPEGATRAAGADSALGAIDNGLDMGVYDIRFILEVYDMSGAAPELAKERMVKCGNETTATFNFRLVPGRDYNFVVWADFVLNDSESDLHYDTNVKDADGKSRGLRAVAIKDWTAIDESRDAYTESVRVDNYNGTSKIGENGVITLTRPFAKLRVVTNDIKEMISIRPSVVKVNYFSTKFYTAFDALYENPIDQTYNGHTLTVNLAEDFYANEKPEETGEQTLFADYFFASQEGDRVMFTMDVETNHGPAIPQVTFNTNIPVKRNNLTTVYGPILTDANNVTVTINPAFENPELEVKVISGHYTETVALEKSGTYIFEDLTVNADDAAVVVKAGAEVVVDVYGYAKLYGKKGIVVEDGAKLTIEGISETRSAERSGSLDVVATEGSAIGGKFITINNLAALTAKAGDVNCAYGIGAIDAEVTINNTKIVYVSGAFVQPLFVNDLKYGKSEPEGASAIGGKKVVLNDVELVKAEGGSKAAAIGNRYWQDTEVVITNSTLRNVFGGNASAAIGGSRYSSDISAENKQTVKIKIENSTIKNAVGGQFGAGIGAGYDTHCVANDTNAVNHIEIINSNITAQGGKYAAGIGTGYHAAALSGSIDAASVVEAKCGEDFYKSGYTIAQNIGYGVVDPAREFNGAVVTFTVAGEVIDTPFVTFIVTKADEFNTAMASGYEYINVILGEDITVAGATGVEYGGADTKMIVIDGNDKTLTYTDSYRTYVKMANAEGKIVFKNMNLYRETTGGSHWHDNNMKFESDTEFNSVNFNKGICLDDAKTFVLNNCKITKSKVSTYGLFITAGCDVTIDGLTIDHAEGVKGRGIKIVDEDVQNPTLTTLTISNSTFKTAAKAAIMVGSSAGADITVSNLKITEVAEDSSNEVWVDEDYAEFVNKVNVVGGSMIVEGNTILADGVVLKKDGVYYISNKAGMFWFANEVNVNKNAFSGKTVKLAANIDLQNTAWTPVGQTGVATFNGVFDGQNYTISNLNVNSEAQTGENYSSGLFGWVESHTAGHGHIKNVKIAGATIVGHHNCGALVGYITQETALVENCHVTGATVTCTKANNDANGDKAGALIGNATVATPVKDCTAANSTVSAGRDAGQVIGAGREANVIGCSATNVAVSANGTSTGANVRNEVIGRLL